LERSRISSNSFGSDRRPLVVMVKTSSWSFGEGDWPTLPAANCAFCSFSARIHRHALAAHFERQARLGLLDAVVDVERRLVDVGADVEGDLDLHHALRGGGRAHVDHVLDAVDLVLERRGDGLLQHQRRGARVDRLHGDHRRRDLGILRHRQNAHRR
jgi:hypothetical protein